MSHAPASTKHAPRRRAVLAASLPWAAVADPARIAWPRIDCVDAPAIEPAHWQDRAAVLVFFLTTCPFCARHNQWVEKLHRAAQGRRLQVLGASLGEPAGVVRDYLLARRLSFPVTLQGLALRPQFTPRTVVPLTAVVGRDGVQREAIPGEMFEEDVLELLRHAG